MFVEYFKGVFHSKYLKPDVLYSLSSTTSQVGVAAFEDSVVASVSQKK